jgi:uncharacterized protein (DUF952 family)
VIYHITSRTSWADAKKSDAYTADSLSTQGFIHCSKADQVVRVADTWYTGQHGLVLLEIDLTRLKPEVRWEPGTDKPDDLFPHIYGPINADAVSRVLDFEPGPDGRFTLPSL